MPEIPHVPGSILVGQIATPFYWTLGPTTFSLRMAGTIFHLAALVLFMILVNRRLGRVAAITCGMLFAWAPPAFAKISVLSYGDHVESLPFIFFAAIYALDWAVTAGTARWHRPFLAGVGASLAIGFHLQGAIGVMAIAITCAIIVIPRLCTLAFWKELFLAFVPGAAVGALPALIVYYYTYSSSIMLWGQSATSHLELGDRTPLDVFAKFAELWISGFSYACQWPHRAVADAQLVFSALCGVALVVGAWRALRRGESTLRGAVAGGGFFFIYAFVFSVIFALSSGSFQIGRGTLSALEVRYFQPLIPILVMPCGILAARMFERYKRAAAWAVLGPMGALGLAGSLSTWNWSNMLHEAARRGYVFEDFGLHPHFATLKDAQRSRFLQVDRAAGNDPVALAKVRESLPAMVEPGAFLQTLRKYDNSAIWTWPMRYPAPVMPVGNPEVDNPDKAIQWIRSVPAEYRTYACVGIGNALGRADPFSVALARKILASGATRDEKVALARGFGRGLLWLSIEGWPAGRIRFFDAERASARIVQLSDDIDPGEVQFGFGFRVGTFLNEFYESGDIALDAAIAYFPRESLGALARGVGAGYRIRYLVPPGPGQHNPGADRIAAHFPARFREAFYAGLAGARDAR
jgi:hypothetical protein